MPVRIVQSKQNARLKELRRALAHSPRAATVGGLAGIEGPNLLEEALRAGLRSGLRLCRAGLGAPAGSAAAAAGDRGSAAAQRAARLGAGHRDPAAHRRPGRAAGLDLGAPARRPQKDRAPLVLVLAGLQDPGNLGTILRSAEAFGAAGVLSLPGTVSAWNPKAVRASAGSVFRLPLLAVSAEDCFARLREAGVKIWTTAVRRGASQPIWSIWPDQLRCSSAMKATACPTELAAQADGAITIPCPGPVESLNAAVAASVLLYEASRQRSALSGGPWTIGESAMSLFDGEPEGPNGPLRTAPLAERMRPRSLEELSGQEHLVGPGKPLRVQIERD